MSEFLIQAKTLKTEAARLRAEPIDDDRRRDEAFSRAAELERQACIEEVLHDLARQPAVDPTPTLDRRTALLSASRADVQTTQDAVDAAQGELQALRTELDIVSRRLLTMNAQEHGLRDKALVQQQQVDDLSDQEAAFYLGRIFNTPRYQAVSQALAASLTSLDEVAGMIGEVHDDILLDDARQAELLDEIGQAQGRIAHAQRAVERAQERVDTNEGLLQEARREEMERRWEALDAAEQVRRIDERRQHDRQVNERQEQWA